MTEKEKREFREEFGDDLMDMIFNMGFEDWYDENAEDLEEKYGHLKEAEKEAYDGVDVDELLAMLDELDGKEISEDDDKKMTDELARLSHEVFMESGTLPNGVWDTIKGAINPRDYDSDDGSMFAFTVCCNGEDVYVISSNEHEKYNIRKDSKTGDVTKDLAIFVYDALDKWANE